MNRQQQRHQQPKVFFSATVEKETSVEALNKLMYEHKNCYQRRLMRRKIARLTKEVAQ